MNVNVSSRVDLIPRGGVNFLCLQESQVLCWATSEEQVLALDTPQKIRPGIYGCVAANDMGSKIALTEFSDKLQPIWMGRYAMGEFFGYLCAASSVLATRLGCSFLIRASRVRFPATDRLIHFDRK